MKQILALIAVLFLIGVLACVGPPELDDGLVENLPSVVNTPDAFTFLVKGDQYTFDETYALSLTLVDSIDVVVTTILVSGYVRGDSTQITILNDQNTILLPFLVDGNHHYVSIDSAKVYYPKTVRVKGKNFTGVINCIIAKQK
jgi:hypothetical protein